MKNEVTRYFPAFFDVDESDHKIIQFETLDELFKIPFVKKWLDTKDFFRFAVSTTGRENQPLLMAQLKEGYEWWAIGFLKYPIDSLPEHEPLYDESKIICKDNRIIRVNNEKA